MNVKMLLVGAATALLAAGASQAATSRHGAYAEPAQPVPYSQLDAYMKASPRVRASKDWAAAAGMNTARASTGIAADTSATTQAAPAAPAQSMPAAPAAASSGQPVNPPASAPADSSTAQPSSGAATSTPTP